MNEAILLATALLDFAAVYAASMYGRVWLYISIVINLRLIVLLGAKLVPLFGHVTNAGNVFYAAVFFAMMLLLEHGTVRDARRGVLIGLISGTAFAILSGFTLHMTSVPETQTLSDMMTQVLSVAPRLTLASLGAFGISQLLIVLIYMQWNIQRINANWWARAFAVVVAGQFVDSVIFFSVAFSGTVTSAEAAGAMFFGFCIKVVLGICTLPVLYLSHRLKVAPSVAVA